MTAKSENLKNVVIRKILNHNVVQGYDADLKKEFLIHGTGIGFRKRDGDAVDPANIAKIYEIQDKSSLSAYESLLQSTEASLIDLSEAIITKLVNRFGSNYDEKLHIALLDHLNFSIYRYRNHIAMQNIFLDEIELMYPNEFQFAKEMVLFVNESLGIELPEAEIGFISMHIHSAYHDDSASETALTINMIGRCMNFIEQSICKKIKPHSIERQRLVTHLKFAFKRAKQKQHLSNPLSHSIIEKYPKTYALATSMANILNDEFMIELSEGEIGYLALHIQNILTSEEC